MKVDASTRAKLVEIGEIIRDVRLRRGVSQAALAQEIGMYRENYLRIEKGRVNLTVETMMRIAEGLGVRFEVVFRAPRGKASSRQRRA